MRKAGTSTHLAKGPLSLTGNPEEAEGSAVRVDEKMEPGGDSPKACLWQVEKEWHCKIAMDTRPGGPVVKTLQPSPDPDFLWTLLALAHFMRLSLTKAAQADVGGARAGQSSGEGLGINPEDDLPAPACRGYAVARHSTWARSHLCHYPSLLNPKSSCETFLSTHATTASLISNQR